MANLGRLLLVAGVSFVVLGAVLLLASRLGLSPGVLPGEIRIETNGGKFYFPLATSLLLSLLLTILLKFGNQDSSKVAPLPQPLSRL